MSSWLITVSEIATQVVVLVVIVGTALDMAPTILILTPILMPIVKQAGIDRRWQRAVHRGTGCFCWTCMLVCAL